MGIRLPCWWTVTGWSEKLMRGWPVMIRRKSSAWAPRSPRMGGVGLPVCSMSQLVRVESDGWSSKSSESTEKGASLMLSPPWPPLRLAGKFGGRWIWTGWAGCWGSEVRFSLEVWFSEVGGLVVESLLELESEIEWSIRATAWAQISPVLRHCMRGQTVSMSVSEWILTVTRVSFAFPPERRLPVMMLAFLVESMTAPCLKRSLPALFAFQPAALAIHFSVISMVAICFGTHLMRSLWWVYVEVCLRCLFLL